MKKILYIFIATFIISSCKPKVVEFDANREEGVASFEQGLYLHPVLKEDAGKDVVVNVSNIVNSDRSFKVQVDEERSTVTSDMYRIDESTPFVIPAGQVSAKVKVLGDFDKLPKGDVLSLVLNLEEVENTVLDRLRAKQVSAKVNMFSFCPFENEATFTGDYEIEPIVRGAVGALFAGNVTLKEGDNPAERVFVAEPLPEYAPVQFRPIEFKILLICGETIVSDQPFIGSAKLGAPSGAKGTFNIADDSEIIVKLTEDKGNALGIENQVSFKLVKKK